MNAAAATTSWLFDIERLRNYLHDDFSSGCRLINHVTATLCGWPCACLLPCPFAAEKTHTADRVMLRTKAALSAAAAAAVHLGLTYDRICWWDADITNHNRCASCILSNAARCESNRSTAEKSCRPNYNSNYVYNITIIMVVCQSYVDYSYNTLQERRHLRSAGRGHIDFPLVRRAT